MRSREATRVTRDEIKVALHQEGWEQGRKQEAARKRVAFVPLHGNEAMGQACQERLARRGAPASGRPCALGGPRTRRDAIPARGWTLLRYVAHA